MTLSAGTKPSRDQLKPNEVLCDYCVAKCCRYFALPIETPEELVILASIIEKETGVPEERRMVAGLYSNRIRQGIFLQADPTIIYPITRGRPLGRRIRQSEIADINDYNTYQMAGLPAGPITTADIRRLTVVVSSARISARCRARLPESDSIWVRQLKPSASTDAPGSASSAGTSDSSATARLVASWPGSAPKLPASPQHPLSSRLIVMPARS